MKSEKESGQRLQVYLAHRGVASRRASAELIKAGQVCVDGRQVFEPGFKVLPQMQVEVNARVIPKKPPTSRTIVIYKPRGYICSTRRQSVHSKLIYDLTGDIEEHLISVGRLDKDSEGLLLLSNSGELIQELTHPRFGHSKTYRVDIQGSVTDAQLTQLRHCRDLDGEIIQPVDVQRLEKSHSETQLVFILKEGRNRQIRRMCTMSGLHVQRLERIAIGTFSASGLAPGQWRDLGAEDIAALKRTAPCITPRSD